MRRGKRKRGKIEKARERSQSAIRSENLMVKQRPHNWQSQKPHSVACESSESRGELRIGQILR